MAYPRELLNEGEEVVLDRRPHWVYMAGPVLFLAGAVILLIATLALGVPSVFTLVAFFVVLGGMIATLARYLKWITTEFVITTDRVIYRAGFIAKHGVEIPLERVQNITSNQTVLERILGLGNLLIQSAGEAGDQTFSHIAKPFVVQNILHAERERSEARDRSQMGSATFAAAAAGGGTQSVPDQLEKLAALRDKGLLTDQEFMVQKAKLLGGDTPPPPGSFYQGPLGGSSSGV